MNTQKLHTIFIKRVYMLLLLSLLFVGMPLVAAETKTEFAVLPVIASSPDTGVMGGLLGMIMFTPTDQEDAPADQLMASAMYTQKQQYSFGLEYLKNFESGKIENEGGIYYSYFPTEYYGLGADTKYADEEKISPLELELTQGLVYGIADNIKLGAKYQFIYYDLKELEESGLFDSNEPEGGEHALISLPSLVAMYDTRDSSIYSTEGYLVSLSSGVNASVFGATQNSSRTEFDYRHFFNLSNREFILGAQVFAVHQAGDVPFTLLEGVGGNDVLRGYAESRYIDKSKYALQTELRYPFPFVKSVSWLAPLSGAVFVGMANVAPSLTEFKNDTTRIAGGAGIRYAVMKEEKVNLRLDFTYNKDEEMNFYIDVMESF